MAFLAAGRKATRGESSAPISAHRAFPAIVSLWFAALLGLGSLVLPTALFETALAVTGISSLVPAAAPPLGATARIVIALSAAAIGAGLGVRLARAVANSRDAEADTDFDPVAITGGRRMPLLASDELDEPGIETIEQSEDRHPAPESAVTRRRSLALKEERPRPSYLPPVPLEYEPVAQVQMEEEAEDEPQAAGMDGEAPQIEAEDPAQDLGESAQTMDAPEFETVEDAFCAEVSGESAQHPAREEFGPPNFDQQDIAMTDEQHFQPFASLESEPLESESSAESGEGEGSEDRTESRVEPTALEEQAGPEQVERETDASPDGGTVAENAKLGRLNLASVSEGRSRPIDSPLWDLPLDQLGLVQLAERLGASIVRRHALLAEQREAEAKKVAAAPGRVNFAALEEAAEPLDAARAIADFFGPSGAARLEDDRDNTPAVSVSADFAPEPLPEVEAEAETEAEPEVELAEYATSPALTAAPLSLSRFRLDDDEDDEDEEFSASLSKSLGRSLASALMGSSASDYSSEPSAEDEVEEEEEEGEYSSLLSMKGPLERKAEFVRIEEAETEGDEATPAVTFPSSLVLKAEVASDPSRPFDPPAAAKSDAASLLSAAPRAASGDSSASNGQDDRERDLRSALAALQRMSGAA